MIQFAPAIAADPVMDEVAEIFTPRKRIKPSQWAEENRILKEGTTPAPGRWRNDYFPWIEAIIDAWFLEVTKDGIVTMKPAQHGITDLFVTLAGYFADQEGGPMCFACTTADDARDFVLNRLDPMIEGSPRLSKIFLRGKANHETILSKMYAGGKVNFVGSGSPNKFISQPYRFFFMDEEDQLKDFPLLGSARSVAEKRVGEYRTRVRCGIFSWAHPTLPDRGVARSYKQESDQREWTLTCPHCGDDIVPRWKDVRVADRDPETAVYITPCCAVPLTDAQRWKATRSGRFVSQLDDKAARRRRYIGFHFSALCHPRISLFELASEYCACVSESQIKVFFNMRMGEPYTPAKFVLTEEAIRAKCGEIAENTCPSDTVFITAGADVQKAGTIFYTVIAWTRRGNAVVIDYGTVQGFAAMDSLSRGFTTTRPDGSVLRISAGGMDYGFETREVYSFCRQDHGGVPWIPVKHTPGVRADVQVRYKKTIDPSRPEMGEMTRLELCRDYWMDRAIGRFSPEADPGVGGSVVLPTGVSDEFINHVKANVQHEEVDEFGHPRIAWVKEKGVRDDYLQAMVFAEVVAVHKGLDKIHELAPAAPQPRQDEIAAGVVQREDRSEGRAGRYTRGRRGRAGRGPYG